MECAVADEKEESADDDAGANLRPGGAQALGQAPEKENRACSKMSDAGRIERRNCLDGVTNSKVGGAADQGDGQERKHHGGAIQPRPGRGGRRYASIKDGNGMR